jgi:hypothetical protein
MTYRIDTALLSADKAANLAFFLQDNAGSIFGSWKGRMSAKDQRALFGRFLGKGLLVINGDKEKISHFVSVCFGTMYDCQLSLNWNQL